MRSYIVLNPHECTYELKRAKHLNALMEKLGCTDRERNGEYIAHNSPVYQVIAVADCTVYDLR